MHFGHRNAAKDIFRRKAGGHTFGATRRQVTPSNLSQRNRCELINTVADISVHALCVHIRSLLGLKQSAAAAFLLAAKVPGKTSQNPQSNRIDEFLADCLVKKRKMPRGPKKRFDADSAAIRRASVSAAVTRMSGNTRNDGGRTQTKREEALYI